MQAIADSLRSMLSEFRARGLTSTGWKGVIVYEQYLKLADKQDAELTMTHTTPLHFETVSTKDLVRLSAAPTLLGTMDFATSKSTSQDEA